MAKATAKTLTMEEIADRLESIEDRIAELEAIARDSDNEGADKVAQIESKVDEIISTLRMG